MLKFINMFLFYSDNVQSEYISLTNDEHIHCTKVLRKNIGDQIFITDGQGHIFTCRIATIQKNETNCEIQYTEIHDIPQPRLGLAISPTKNAARIEWFVEKAVEIGISDIFFTHTQRTEKKAINIQRLEKILISAMKQSMNVHLPTLQTFKSVDELTKSVSHLYEQKYIAHCDGPTLSLNEAIDRNKSALLMIGPEGDFTKEEINLSQNANFIAVSLGPSRLRTETAGLVGLMMMKY